MAPNNITVEKNFFTIINFSLSHPELVKAASDYAEKTIVGATDMEMAKQMCMCDFLEGARTVLELKKP